MLNKSNNSANNNNNNTEILYIALIYTAIFINQEVMLDWNCP